MASKSGGKSGAEKMAHGNIKRADIQTAAVSSQGPTDFEKGYPAPEHPLRNSYGKKK